jgi:DNA-binding NarL/FixJ family response regulator
MPEMNGYELTKIIKKDFPNIKVINFSMHYSEYFVSQMIINGANAFIPKSGDFDLLIEAIYCVHRDGYYFNKSISQMIITSFMSENKVNSFIKQLTLSHRETQVLKLICDGMTNKQIGECMGIEACTVDFHRQSIYKKTNSSNIVDLVKYAIRNGITTLE